MEKKLYVFSTLKYIHGFENFQCSKDYLFKKRKFSRSIFDNIKIHTLTFELNLNQLVRRNFSVTMEYPINFASWGWSLSKEGYNVGLGYWVNAKLSLESSSSSASSWNNDWPSVQILWPWKKKNSVKTVRSKIQMFFFL